MKLTLAWVSCTGYLVTFVKLHIVMDTKRIYLDVMTDLKLSAENSFNMQNV